MKKVTTTMSQILCIIRDIVTHSADKSSHASGTRWVRPPSAQDDKHNHYITSVYPQFPYRKPYKVFNLTASFIQRFFCCLSKLEKELNKQRQTLNPLEK